jgi:hypothetical protein
MTTLTLGDLEFARYEIPQAMPFGTEQKLNVHQLVGGKRVIDVLGAIPRNPTWSGWFVGSQALARARYLKGLCEAGKPLSLKVDELSMTVVIHTVECDFRQAWRIPYTVTCEVVSDDTAPITDRPSPSVDQLVSDDMTSSTSLAAGLGIPSLTSAVSSVSTALANVKTFVGAAQSQIQSVLAPIAAARVVVGSLLNQASTTLAAVGNLSSLNGAIANPVSDFVNRLSLTSTNAANSGILAQLDKNLARMQANISAVNSGTASVTLGGGNLYQLAAAEYGDPMAWTTLAQANRVTDPTLSGITTVVVPPKPSAAQSTGILNA